MLIDAFHDLYNLTFRIENAFLNLIKIPAILRLMILSLANFCIPLLFSIKTGQSNFCLEESGREQVDFVVSLTSFPERIAKVHLVVESLLRQTVIPKKIVLWLSREQFNSLDVLPKKLLDLQGRGLEIHLMPGDLRSYKKYYYLLQDQPDTSFIIVDDDIFYPSTLIENLISTHTQYPNAVCANRCARINSEKPYREWISVKGLALEPCFNLLPTGCGGVLYPSGSLHSDALNEPLFTKICKDADDIWLSNAAYLNNTPTAYTGKNEYLLSVYSIGNVHLHTKNVGESNNDQKIELVKKHYQSTTKANVFNRN